MTQQADSLQSRAHRAWQAGQQLVKRGRFQDAAERFQTAIRLQPKDRLYKLNLAQVMLRQEKPEEACELLKQAVRENPQDELVLKSLLQCLEVLKRDEDLVEVLTSVPSDVLTREMLVCLGSAQSRLRQYQQAASTWLMALARDVTDAPMHVRLGYALYELRLKSEAAECLRTALALGLGRAQAGCTDLLMMYEREVCDWSAAAARMSSWRGAIEQLPDDASQELSPFCQAVLLDDPALQLKAARVFARFLEGGVARAAARQPVRRERIRVGYLSSDLHNHATSLLMTQLLEQHDRSRFEVFLYSYGPDDGSAERKRILGACEHTVDLYSSNVAEMVSQIRADEIDILVDLKGYTKEARPLVMAARAAPVQVAYLGYPGTMGADFIDYVIGDRWVTPLSEAHHFSEKIAQLPGCYQCNDATRQLPIPPSRASQGLPDDAFVLCAFNQLYKISPEVFDVWCRVLQRVPNSVLWLLQTVDSAVEVLRQEAVKRGVDPSRLHFAKLVPNQQHLDRLACADLFIDTWPCNGHTSTSDALWAGLPVVTLSGKTFASRVAGSLLEAVGLGQLACTSDDDYQNLIVKLAQDASARAVLRARLAEARISSPLFDGKLRAREIEALYERMWERALRSLAPEALPAAGEATCKAVPSATFNSDAVA